MGDDLGALGTAINGASGRVTAGVQKIKNLERLAAETRANLAAARSNREALENEVAKSQEMVNKVHDALLWMISLNRGAAK